MSLSRNYLSLKCRFSFLLHLRDDVAAERFDISVFPPAEKGNVIVMTFTIWMLADLDPQPANFLIQLADINLEGCDNVSQTNGFLYQVLK